MLIEDGTAPTLAAASLLLEQREQLGCPNLAIWTRDGFVSHAALQALDISDRRAIIDQAILSVEQFYAHLPFKRARYGLDPVQCLRLVRARLREFKDDAEFHGAILTALTSLRDAHTFYGLPAPFRDAFAFLPFRMKCAEGASAGDSPLSASKPLDRRRFIVTGVTSGFSHPTFGRGAEIHLWNGNHIETAVENQGLSDAGANAAARFLRGMARMTAHSLTFCLPPEESWVVIQYSPAGSQEQLGIVLPWTIVSDCTRVIPARGTSSSICESMAEAAYLHRVLCDREEYMRSKDAEWHPHLYAVPDPSKVSSFPTLIQFQYSGGTPGRGLPDPAMLADPSQQGRRFGYIRIVSFEEDEARADDFVTEFQRIATLMQNVAPDGLILDLRANPGGVIPMAERLLQFFTLRNVEPAHFHLVSTTLTRHIASVMDDGLNADDDMGKEWSPWMADLVDSIVTGEVVTHGRPLTSSLDANDQGQCYRGSVVLLTDAATYSAADIFAAGFQDHHAGVVVGLDATTGGGGANGFRHDELVRQLTGVDGVALHALPKGAQLGLALRRSSRVGPNAGMALEDLGVSCDLRYFRTEADLLENDRELFPFLCRVLGETPVYSLLIQSVERDGDFLTVSFAVSGELHRIECLINGFTQLTLPGPVTGPVRVPLLGISRRPVSLRVEGYALVTDKIRGQRLQLAATDSAPVPEQVMAAGSA